MKNVPYKAPNFRLKDQNGKLHELSDYAGTWLVLYFYPKDDTPGCTVEACSFRDARDDLADAGAVVIGVSKDAQKSHSNFSRRHSLNFTLLSDEEGKVIEAYGAWGKKMFGREGILRKTYIIDPKGQVRKVYGRATPLGHGKEVLTDLQLLQKKSN